MGHLHHGQLCDLGEGGAAAFWDVHPEEVIGGGHGGPERGGVGGDGTGGRRDLETAVDENRKTLHVPHSGVQREQRAARRNGQ